MYLSQSSTNNVLHLKAKAHLNGAAFLNKKGNEIPITDSMIKHACENSQEVWPFAPIDDGLTIRKHTTD